MAFCLSPALGAARDVLRVARQLPRRARPPRRAPPPHLGPSGNLSSADLADSAVANANSALADASTMPGWVRTEGHRQNYDLSKLVMKIGPVDPIT